MMIAEMPRAIGADTTFLEEAVVTSFEQKSHRNREEQFEDQFSEMVEAYSSMAYNIALRMLRNTADAEDAVQEAFISAYRAFPKFKGQSKVSTWLYRIVVNACLMKIRKEQVRSKYLANTGYDDSVVPNWRDADSPNEPERAALNSELRDLLDEGLSRLSPELRAAVVLRDVQGFTTEEAATTLDLTVSSLKARLHRGRVLLRKHLEGYLVIPTPLNPNIG
jgi:RNA polymerase sigma-70 factor (ECF subfamily)